METFLQIQRKFLRSNKVFLIFPTSMHLRLPQFMMLVWLNGPSLIFRRRRLSSLGEHVNGHRKIIFWNFFYDTQFCIFSSEMNNDPGKTNASAAFNPREHDYYDDIKKAKRFLNRLIKEEGVNKTLTYHK